jgi:hypothetical protein
VADMKTSLDSVVHKTPNTSIDNDHSDESGDSGVSKKILYIPSFEIIKIKKKLQPPPAVPRMKNNVRIKRKSE